MDTDSEAPLIDIFSETSSYTALAGFGQPPKPDSDEVTNQKVSPGILEQVETQAKINEMADKLLKESERWFIRPLKKMSAEDQIKFFGEVPTSVSEVISDTGTRILLVGFSKYWKNVCNLNDPDPDKELQRYTIVNSDGDRLFNCSLFSDFIKINMGKLTIGQVTLRIQTSLDCSDWEPIIMIVEDHLKDQLFRFEKNKTVFDVLMYPEQLPVCTVSSRCWNSKDYPFLGGQRVFCVPFPDNMGFRKRALVFTSSLYIYDKYYQKSKLCQIAMVVFALFSVIIILSLIIVQRLGLLDAKVGVYQSLDSNSSSINDDVSESPS